MQTRPARRRPSAAVYRRRRLTVGAVFLAVVALIVMLLDGGPGHHSAAPSSQASSKSAKTSKTAKPRTAAAVSGPPRLEVSLASWQLPTPSSRAVALPTDDGYLNVFGGLTGTGNATSPAVVRIDPTSGAEEPVGQLPVPVHDAAGAAIGSREFVFGGGATTLTADTQSYSTAVTQGTPSIAVAGSMPAARADLAAARSGNGTVYLVGGYDGTTLTTPVWSTRDGTTFSTVGQLGTPVRYPAVVVSGSQLLVIGGETTVAGGTDTADIQAVNLDTGQSSVVGQLPVPLAHASAVILDGTVYLFGGRSNAHVVDTVYKLAAGPAGWVATADGTLPLPTADMAVATLGQTAYLVGGEGQLGQPLRSVVVARMVTPGSAAAASSGPPPFQGQLLIADRGNDRLLLVNAQKQVQWMFPSLLHPAPSAGFYFPDDAFFARHGTEIITNQEDQNTIEVLSYPSGGLVQLYGHPNVAGSAPGYLNQPDDAYMLKDGSVTVADAKNCRIVFLNPDFSFKSAIGTRGACQHDIPLDVAYPNGDTPLENGNFLVSEILGSYVDEVTAAGQVVWSLKLPIAYPSDPQQIGPDLYLIADYTSPGGLFEFTREGQIVWSYQPTSGEGMLDHPSLAEQLPNGLICVNDDYRNRVVIIDPKANRIVWQYGDTDTAGTGPGLLKIPDGFDLLLPDGSTPTHPSTA